ncbi:tyrosine-type recombinase/integrase [Devosia albogilva]|uniref:Tyrosine-type recombinase/integrase n=1 Tax=Devosia albogilva TaxID=429726 RepID=A0ABW5QM54_9HYPH
MPSWPDALQRLEGAYSDHTLRAYRSGFVAFSSWCRRRRRPALPASPETVAAYLDEESARLKPATLKQRLCAIRKIHQLSDLKDPTAHPDVELAMRRARRAQPTRPKQALGITATLRDQLLAACADDLMGLRDKVLVSVGFDTLCRRGELVSISIEDLTRTGQGRYTVLVRRAKNDPEGTGRIAHLSTQSTALIDSWLDKLGTERGPLLRPVYRRRVPALHLTPATVSRILKRITARAVEVNVSKKVSGHSLRVGAAQQLTLDGKGILQIMRAGGWRSMNVVARYVENIDADVWN